jgi:hypothetical protein
MSWGAIDGSDGQASIPAFDTYIRCLDLARFILGKLLIFYVVSNDYG